MITPGSAWRVEVDTSLGGVRGVRVLEELKQRRGLPRQIRSDNGPEFVSRAVDQWAYEQGLEWHTIQPGRPMENGYVESFNGRFRDECLNENWFRESGGRAGEDRRVATGLQRAVPAQQLAIPNPSGVCSASCKLLKSWTGARGLKRRPLAPDPHPRYAAGRTKRGESPIIFGLETGGTSSSRDICERERARVKGVHRILHYEFYVECSCSYKGISRNHA